MRGRGDIIDARVQREVDGQSWVAAVVAGELRGSEGQGTALAGRVSQSLPKDWDEVGAFGFEKRGKGERLTSQARMRWGRVKAGRG